MRCLSEIMIKMREGVMINACVTHNTLCSLLLSFFVMCFGSTVHAMDMNRCASQQKIMERMISIKPWFASRYRDRPLWARYDYRKQQKDRGWDDTSLLPKRKITLAQKRVVNHIYNDLLDGLSARFSLEHQIVTRCKKDLICEKHIQEKLQRNNTNLCKPVMQFTITKHSQRERWQQNIKNQWEQFVGCLGGCIAPLMHVSDMIMQYNAEHIKNNTGLEMGSLSRTISDLDELQQYDDSSDEEDDSDDSVDDSI